MKRFAIGCFAAAISFATVTFADEGRISTRADAVRVMVEIRQHMDEQSSAFAQYAEAAQKTAALYVVLDRKAKAVAGLVERCGRGCPPDVQSQLMAATKDMQETQMAMNLQYLQLQSQMDAANRRYSAVSTIMKTKHDTVKNSISNVR